MNLTRIKLTASVFVFLTFIAPISVFGWVTDLTNPTPNPLTVGVETELTVDVSVQLSALGWGSTEVWVDGQPYACVVEPNPGQGPGFLGTEVITIPVMAPLDQPGTYSISVEDYADTICSETGTGNEFSLDIEVLPAPPPPQATFAVSKDYTDGNPDSVEVTLTCNSGLPLVQSFVISEGSPVHFVVNNLTPGMQCEVTESGSADGYTPGYNDGEVNSATSCLYEDVDGGEHSCVITNVLDPVIFEVNAEWEFDTQVEPIESTILFDFYCENYRASPDGPLENSSGQFELDDDFAQTFGLFFPNYTTPVSRCRFDTTAVSSAVELDDGCSDWTNMMPGDESVSCTVTATVFFEGIPSLSPAGLVMLALMMLGLGFYGFRRIV